MKKFIFGFYDSVSGNIGDVCILDREEEFRDGAIRILSHPSVPVYAVNDVIGLCYGELVYGEKNVPRIVPYKIPRTVIRGDCIDVCNARRCNLEISGNPEEASSDPA